MRLFRFELKKLVTNRFMLWGITALAAACVMLALFKADYGGTEATYGDLDAVWQKYSADPETVNTYYGELQKKYDEYTEILMQEMDKGNYDYHVPPMPSEWATGGYDDYFLLKTFFKKLDYAENGWHTKLEATARAARRQLEAYDAEGADRSGFMYLYNYGVYSMCTAGEEKPLPYQTATGWDRYFNFDTVNILIAAFALLVAPIAALSDRSDGSEYIIRATKKGRLPASLAKIIAAVTVTAAGVLILSTAALAATAIRYGLSPASTYMQSFVFFALCPWFITVLEAFFINVALRMLIFCSCTVLFTAVAALLGSYKFSALFSLIFFAGNYAASLISGVETFAFVKYCNTFTAADAENTFSRYNAVRLAGGLAEQNTAVYIMFPAILILSAAAFCLLRNKINRIPSVKLLKKPLTLRSFSPRTLFGYEAKKSLLASKMLIVFAAAVAVQCFVSDRATSKWESYNDDVYRGYCMRLDGPLTPEKEKYVEDEMAELQRILGMEEEMYTGYTNGTVGEDEYGDYKAKLYSAQYREQAVKKIHTQLLYIRSEAADGRSAYFVYDTGFLRLFRPDMAYTLLALLLLAMSGIWADEYTSGIYPVIRTAKNGRRRLLRAKSLYTVAFTICAFAVLCGTETYYITARTALTSFSAPVSSIAGFVPAGTDMTMAGYTALLFVMRFIGCVLFAFAMSAMSKLFRRSLYAMFAAAVIWLLPSAAGLPVSIRPLSSVTPTELFGVSPSGCAVYYAVFAAVVIAATALSCRTGEDG